MLYTLSQKTIMMHRNLLRGTALLCSFMLLPLAVYGQGTLADYEKATTLRTKVQGLVAGIPERTNWLDKNRFWYRKTVKGGNEFVMIDAETAARKAPFDHEKLAASLSAASGEKYTAITLPFTTFTFTDSEQVINFEVI